MYDKFYKFKVRHLFDNIHKKLGQYKYIQEGTFNDDLSKPHHDMWHFKAIKYLWRMWKALNIKLYIFTE